MTTKQAKRIIKDFSMDGWQSEVKDLSQELLKRELNALKNIEQQANHSTRETQQAKQHLQNLIN